MQKPEFSVKGKCTSTFLKIIYIIFLFPESSVPDCIGGMVFNLFNFLVYDYIFDLDISQNSAEIVVLVAFQVPLLKERQQLSINTWSLL